MNLCPHCGKPLSTGYDRYECPNPKCRHVRYEREEKTCPKCRKKMMVKGWVKREPIDFKRNKNP